MNKRLETKILQQANNLNRQVRCDDVVLGLNELFSGDEVFDYVIASKLGVLDKYKEIVETGVMSKNDRNHSSYSLLGKMVGNGALIQLVNSEFAEMFPEDVFIQREGSTILEFNSANSTGIKKIDIITWLRTQPNFYKDGSTYGLSVRVNNSNQSVQIKF